MGDSLPAIPLPFAPGEAIGTADAALRAGVSERTMREWCPRHGIGRRIGGRWRVSVVALEMLLSGDREALEAYRMGNRATESVRAYLSRLGETVSCREPKRQ